MLLLISHEADQSCTEVIEWLSQAPVYRWNTDTELLPHWAWPWPKPIPSLQAIWFRKYSGPKSSPLTPALQAHQQAEWQAIRQDFIQQLQAPKMLGDSRFDRLPKLQQLRLAQECGLRVPDYGIFSSKQQALHFVAQKGQVALKVLSGQPKGSRQVIYTQRLLPETIAPWPELVSPVFLQHYIPKRYELRIFFLDGDCFCLGIDSQALLESRIDFRRKAHQLDMAPYQLPADTERQLQALFKQLKLNCGSVDMLRGEDGKLYFLEINPVGQFGFFKQGLFQLEKRIAHWLLGTSD